MNKRTNKSIVGGKTLNLNKETVLHLSRSSLQNVIGGQVPNTANTRCESRCKDLPG